MITQTFFKLKEPKATKPTPIFLISYFNKTRFKYSTGLKILPEYWNPESETATLKKVDVFTRNENEAINFEVQRIRRDFTKIVRNITIDQTAPDHDFIKAKLIEADPNKKPQKPKQKKLSFTDFVKSYIADSEAGKYLTNKQTVKKQSTIGSYKVSLYRLEKYERYKRKKLQFEDININFYNDFVKWLQAENYAQNSIAHSIKQTKVFLKAAHKLELTTNTAFNDPDFKKVESTSTKVYLSVDEIESLANLELTGQKDNSRDLFILACWSGLRYNDLINLKNENINLERNLLTLTTSKTGQKVTIPLHRLFIETLIKRNYILPKKTANHIINSDLRTLCKMAGITEKIQVTEYRAGMRVDKYLPKHELITFHTARRSFATNLFLAGIPAISIMKLTGHNTESSFLKYIRVSSEENAELISKNQLFSHLKIAK